MTNLITEARELCEKATPGPWVSENMKLSRAIIGGTLELLNWASDKPFYTKQDFDFIARSRTLIPELCDALEKAHEQNKQLARELSELARESVEREKTLARLEAEVEAALREQAEREKGCTHCQKPYVSIGGINEDKAIIYLGAERPYTKGNVEYLHHMDSAGRMNAFKVRHCPMCGRRLEVEP